MSNEAPFQTTNSGRALTREERRLVAVLLRLSDSLLVPPDWLDTVRVMPMSDGGMGSLQFLPLRPAAKMGAQASEVEFIDADGIPVLASLNLDQDGKPFELEMFKADSSKLIRIPAALI